VFEVTETPDVLKIEMNDPMVMGKIEVHKTGEVLTGVKEKEESNFLTKAWDSFVSLFANKKEILDTNFEFIYEEVPLKDATYEIVLTEDVYYPNQVDSQQNPIIYIDDTGL